MINSYFTYQVGLARIDDLRTEAGRRRLIALATSARDRSGTQLRSRPGRPSLLSLRSRRPAAA